LQAAESIIRDTDMASVMVDYTRDNILVQAGTSMLAQANQKAQSVLQLLQ
jgi:flagellin